jgi:hypothetical protein
MRNKIIFCLLIISSLNLLALDKHIDKPVIAITKPGIFSENEAEVYSMIINPNSIKLVSNNAKKPSIKNNTKYRLPTKRDRYILKALNKKGEVVSLIGLGDPFTIHADHIGYENSESFSTIVKDQTIEVILPSYVKVEAFSILYQDEYGLRTLSSTK